MRKVVILNSSPRRNGNSDILSEAVASGVRDNGGVAEKFDLAQMNINPCKGCYACQMGRGNPCVQKDDMDQIYEACREADIVVFASPVYWFSVTGTLKTAVDRLYAPQCNWGAAGFKKETVFLMTSGSPAEYNPLAVEWYRYFERMLGWKSLGIVLGTGKTEEARKLGGSIA